VKLNVNCQHLDTLGLLLVDLLHLIIGRVNMNIDKELDLLTAEFLSPLVDELWELIPDDLKEANKDAILHGKGCFVVNTDGITPINQRELYKALK